MMISVELYETQLAFLDKVVEQAQHGSTRAIALRRIVLEHVGDRLEGAAPYVGGAVREEIVRTKFPQYGEGRYHEILQPVTGKAIPVHKGEVLRIEQVVGGQCVDFNAFNLRDYKEFLDCGFTRSFQSFDPGVGEFIWTNAPRGRPMFAILDRAETCDFDIVGHRCNRVSQELGWGITHHPNCQDTLAEAIREFRLTPDDVHDSFNLWMSTTIDEQGRRQFKWNPGRMGDRVDFLAVFDVLAVVVTCGIGDLVGVNNYTFAPVAVDVFTASQETTSLVEIVEDRWGSLETQADVRTFAVKDVLASRELVRDESYQPSFLPLPEVESVEVKLSEEELAVVQGLIATGVYGETPGEAIRASFMRWCNTHMTRMRKARLVFDGVREEASRK